MGRIIITKENNVITKEKLVKENNINKEKVTEPKAFDFLKTNNNTKDLKQIVAFIFQIMKNRNESYKIKEIYMELQNVKNKEQLEKIFETTINNLNIDNTIENKTKKFSTENEKLAKKLNLLYKKEKDNTLNEFANRTITEYYNMIVRKLSMDSIKALETIILKNNNTDKVMGYLNPNIKEEDKKTNFYQISKNALLYAINRRYFGNESHLCWNCATPILKCPKILDVVKKEIG